MEFGHSEGFGRLGLACWMCMCSLGTEGCGASRAEARKMAGIARKSCIKHQAVARVGYVNRVLAYSGNGASDSLPCERPRPGRLSGDGDGITPEHSRTEGHTERAHRIPTPAISVAGSEKRQGRSQFIRKTTKKPLWQPSHHQIQCDQIFTLVK